MTAQASCHWGILRKKACAIITNSNPTRGAVQTSNTRDRSKPGASMIPYPWPPQCPRLRLIGHEA